MSTAMRRYEFALSNISPTKDAEIAEAAEPAEFAWDFARNLLNDRRYDTGAEHSRDDF
jgi:hypothetical protein